MYDELIKQAREPCEKATPGPWEVKVKGNTVESHQVMSPGNGPICSAISPKTKNAQFIATSRTLVPQLCDALEAAEKREEAQKWIPVKERLPENGIDVLLYWSNDAQNKKYVDMERYHIDHWETLDRPWIRAIAWMPLPQPPQKG